MRFDAVIIGGGPSGLSAALFLGRARRRVAIIDDGRPRNAVAPQAHGFFTRDGIAPRELLALGRRELAKYDVVFFSATAVDVKRDREGFTATLSTRRRVSGRTLLLATGLKDQLPQLDGIAPLYGKSVFHCVHCDGWEHRDQPLAAYGRGRDGAEIAMGLTTWSRDVVLCTDGARRMSSTDKAMLDRHGIAIRTEPIARLEGKRGQLERIVFAGGEPLKRRALFFHTVTSQTSPIAARLGLDFNLRGAVRTGTLESTGVPRLFVAGDASKDVAMISVAVAEGTKAGFAMNRLMCREEWSRRPA